MIEHRDIALPSTPQELSAAAIRHRRFFRGGQQRREIGLLLTERDDDEEDDDDDKDDLKVKAVDANGNEIPDDDDDVSSDDETSTQSTTTATTSQSETSTKPTLTASTTTVNQNPPLSSIALPITVTPAAVSSTTSAKTQFTAAPEVESTFSFEPLKSTMVSTYTTKASPTNTNTALAEANGNSLGQTGKATAKDHMPPGEIAAIVFGVMGAILAILFLIILVIRKRHRAAQSLNPQTPFNEKPTPSRPSTLTYASRFAWLFRSTNSSSQDHQNRRRPASSNAESRIWGSASTSYGAPTVIDVPAYVPANMQRGGLWAGGYDANIPTSTSAPLVRSQQVAVEEWDATRASVVEPSPAAKPRNGNTAAMQNGVLRVPSRWFARDSTVSVPRFRDIKSWAVDQRDRVSGKSSGGMSSLGVGSADTETGIPKLGRGRYERMDD